MSEFIDYYDQYTGHDRWYSVYTIQLGELIASGLFDWNKDILNWRDAAIDDAQYERICKYFIERYYFREISIEPFYRWAKRLHTKLVHELMPKYKPLYERLQDGINPLADSDEYYKERDVTSAYPETLLSGNADYASDGRDVEHEKIVEGNAVDNAIKFALQYKAVDELFLDDLESMFVDMYTSHVNGW